MSEQQTKCPQCGSFQRPTPLTAFDAPLVTCGHSWHLVEPTPPATPPHEEGEELCSRCGINPQLVWGSHCRACADELRGIPPATPQRGEPTCPGPDCPRCSGEYCDTHYTTACECDSAQRHMPRFTPATPQPETPDVTCEHGTATDVHCCHCHSGFIFDMNHECPPKPRGWREALEDALGLDSDAENHTSEWAFETVRAIREIGNAAAPPPDVERLEVLVYQIEGGGPFDATDVRLERRKNREGISRWAVVNRSCVLNKEGEWEWEPIPSSRTDEYLARTRFDTPSDALAAFRALSPSTPGEGQP